jgi:hypothetical protein
VLGLELLPPKSGTNSEHYCSNQMQKFRKNVPQSFGLLSPFSVATKLIICLTSTIQPGTMLPTVQSDVPLPAIQLTGPLPDGCPLEPVEPGEVPEPARPPLFTFLRSGAWRSLAPAATEVHAKWSWDELPNAQNYAQQSKFS